MTQIVLEIKIINIRVVEKGATVKKFSELDIKQLFTLFLRQCVCNAFIISCIYNCCDVSGRLAVLLLHYFTL